MIDSRRDFSRSTQLVVLMMLITLPTKTYLIVNAIGFLTLLWNWIRFEKDERIFLSPLLSLSWLFLMAFYLISYVSGVNLGYSDLTTFGIESVATIAIPPLFALNRGHLFWERFEGRSLLVNGLLAAWVVIAFGGKLGAIFPDVLSQLPSAELAFILFTLLPFGLVVLSDRPDKKRRWNYLILIAAGMVLVAEPPMIILVTMLWVFNTWKYFKGSNRLKLMIAGSLMIVLWVALRILWPKIFGLAFLPPEKISQVGDSWRFYLGLVSDYPVTGFGPNLSDQFLESRILERQMALSAKEYSSSILAVLAQGGISGLCFFLGWIVCVFLSALKETKSAVLRRSYCQAIVVLFLISLTMDFWGHPEGRQIVMLALAWLFSITTRIAEKSESALPAV